MEKPVLCDKDIYPDEPKLRNALGACYTVYADLFDNLKKSEYQTVSNWKYYNDGKSWLLRTEYKKKTLFWLSVWKGYFKVSFYFTEKNVQDIISMNIDKQLIENFRQTKPVGKLLPLVISVSRNEQIQDILLIMNYKIKLK